MKRPVFHELGCKILFSYVIYAQLNFITRLEGTNVEQRYSNAYSQPWCWKKDGWSVPLPCRFIPRKDLVPTVEQAGWALGSVCSRVAILAELYPPRFFIYQGSFFFSTFFPPLVCNILRHNVRLSLTLLTNKLLELFTVSHVIGLPFCSFSSCCVVGTRATTLKPILRHREVCCVPHYQSSVKGTVPENKSTATETLL